jgi:solute carrier family 25 iron transporter 28/37
MTVPFTAAQLTIYKHMKKFMNPQGNYSPLSQIVAEGIAGGVAAGPTTPSTSPLQVLLWLLQL